jgi:hypothetical protein
LLAARMASMIGLLTPAALSLVKSIAPQNPRF